MNLDDVLNREELSPTGVDEVNAAMDHIAFLEAENAALKNELLPLRIDFVALKRELLELREASANYMDAVMHMRYSEIEKTLPILRALLKK